MFKKMRKGYSIFFLLLASGAEKVFCSEETPREKKWPQEIEFELYRAINTLSLSTVKAIADKYPEILHVQDCSGATPLHLAADLGSVEIAEYLLSRGASINARDKDKGDTPLHRAAKAPRTERIARCLIQAGADVNARNNAQNTPIHFATQRGYLDLVRLLIHNGADVYVQDKYGNTVLNYASRSGSLDCVQFLVQNYDFNINQANSDMITPLHYAAGAGSKQPVMEFLLCRGADMNARDIHKNTCFHYLLRDTLRWEHPKCWIIKLMLLLKKGYRLDKEDTIRFKLGFGLIETNRYAIDVEWLGSIFALQEATIKKLPEDLRKLLLSFVLDISDAIEPKELRSWEELDRLVHDEIAVPYDLKFHLVGNAWWGYDIPGIIVKFLIGQRACNVGMKNANREH